MNAVIISDFQARVQRGELQVITATGRTTNFQELDKAGNVTGEGGVCTDPECDCAGEWWSWKESK